MNSDENLRTNFLNWVDNGLRDRGWSIRELGRRAEVSVSNISNIRRGVRGVTWDLVAGIAEAFGERPEEAFRQVGLLPNYKTEAEKLQEILSYLPDNEVAEVLKYAEWKRKEMVSS